MKRSWLFFFCALLLSRNRSWNRLAGTSLSLAYTVYLSFRGVSSRWPWPVLANVVGNVSYLVASLNAEQSQLPTYLDLSLKAMREHDEGGLDL